jgi:ketosteroid isomerase-like protein
MAMYHFFVRRHLREVIRRLNAGDFSYITRQFHPRAEHWFSGQHAMAGRRTSSTAIASWYARLAAVFPGIRFTVHKLLVSGPPWNTEAAVEWTDVVRDRAGESLPNHGVFVLRLRWGRATEFHVYCDTAQIEKNLATLASQGVVDAEASPIVG